MPACSSFKFSSFDDHHIRISGLTTWHWQEFPYPEYWTAPTKADNVFIFAYNMTNIIVTTF